jgi:uncharacterized protein (DUF779 family)
MYFTPCVKNIVRKIQLDIDVIVFFFSRLCCDSASPALGFYLCPVFKHSLRR